MGNAYNLCYSSNNIDDVSMILYAQIRHYLLNNCNDDNENIVLNLIFIYCCEKIFRRNVEDGILYILFNFFVKFKKAELNEKNVEKYLNKSINKSMGKSLLFYNLPIHYYPFSAEDKLHLETIHDIIYVKVRSKPEQIQEPIKKYSIFNQSHQ